MDIGYRIGMPYAKCINTSRHHFEINKICTYIHLVVITKILLA